MRKRANNVKKYCKKWKSWRNIG